MKMKCIVTGFIFASLCLLVWFAVPVLHHWNWRQDKIGGSQAGSSHRPNRLLRRFTKYQLLADARTLAAAVRYILEPDVPSPASKDRPFTPGPIAFAATNFPGLSNPLHPGSAPSHTVPRAPADEFAVKSGTVQAT